MKISAVVITLNEEKNIEGCLKSVSFCDEIVVVDSGSADATISLAQKYTPHVFHRPFDHFSAQKNEALSKATSDWILSIDADERVSDPLREEILRIVHPPERNEALCHSERNESLCHSERSEAERRISAYRIPRKNFIFGQHLKYGANRNDAPIRLFRRGVAVFEGIIHERLVLKPHAEKCHPEQDETTCHPERNEVKRRISSIPTLKFPLIHLSSPTLKAYLRRLDQYTQLEAAQLYERGEKFSYVTFLTKPPLRFVQRYFLQRGFLDGGAGFIYSVLSGFYEFVRYAKLWEIPRR